MDEIVQWQLRADITIDELIKEYRGLVEQQVEARKATAKTGGFSEAIARSNLNRCSTVLIERFIQSRYKSICVWCGHLEILKNPDSLREQMAEHITICSDHPLNKVATILESAENLIESVLDMKATRTVQQFDAAVALKAAIGGIQKKIPIGEVKTSNTPAHPIQPNGICSSCGRAGEDHTYAEFTAVVEG